MLTRRHLLMASAAVATLAVAGQAFAQDKLKVLATFSILGDFVRNVRRWRDGAMLVRWVATGLQDAQPRFRRIKGCGEMPALIRALDRHQVDTKKAVA